jgi:hypothetical protein
LRYGNDGETVRTLVFQQTSVTFPLVAGSGTNWDKSCVFRSVPAYVRIAPTLVCKSAEGLGEEHYSRSIAVTSLVRWGNLPVYALVLVDHLGYDAWPKALTCRDDGTSLRHAERAYRAFFA